MRNGNEQLRRIREERRMSQAALAAMVGVTQASISAIEVGDTKSPSLDLARSIARALGVSLEAVFPESLNAA